MTGEAGFIGFNLCKHLLGTGCIGSEVGHSDKNKQQIENIL